MTRNRCLALTLAGLVAIATLVGIPPSPATAASGPSFTVMNTSETPPDGVWFRNTPHTADTNRITGLGVYVNEQVQLECYAFGDAVGRYNDSLWYFTLNVSRPSNGGAVNQGFLNAHYINDGQNANVVDGGVPACVNNAPPVDAPPPVQPPVQQPPTLQSTTPATVVPPPTSTPFAPPLKYPSTPSVTHAGVATTATSPNPSNVKRIVNADGGVYWRSGPQWSFVVNASGHGVYNGDLVSLDCYINGGTVPPLNNNTLWYFASIDSGRGIGSGYLNDHFLDTGLNVPNAVVPGVPGCKISGGAGGVSGGGMPTYSLPPPLPQLTTGTTSKSTASSASGPNLTSVDNVQLGSARDGWHSWGACIVRDYDGPNKQWVIVVKQSGSNYVIVRNGMLFGWFDNKGGPGGLGCPAANEAVQATDQASGVSWSTQQFQGGTLYWSTGMDHAANIGTPALAAIRWAWHCIPSGTCNYHTTNGAGAPTAIPNYYQFCLGFVYDAYRLQGFTPTGGPSGDDALAKEWWTENTTGRKSAAHDLMAAPGAFPIWNGTDGHIALSIGGGYAISTYSGGVAAIHIAKIADIESQSIYFGWITPGV